MSLFRRIHTKHLKSLTQRIDDANNFWAGPAPWQPWFAWYPVKVKGRWTWFKKVYRKEIHKTYVNHDDWTRYEYGDVFDVLKND